MLIGRDKEKQILQSSLTCNIPPKGVIFSDFICTFTTSLMILLVVKRITKVSEKSDIAKS